MADEVKRVYTEGGTLAFPQLNTVGDIDNAVVNMLFQSGALGNVEVSRNALYGYDIRTEILGTEGGLQIGYYRQTPLLIMTRQGISHDMVPYLWSVLAKLSARRKIFAALLDGVPRSCGDAVGFGN